MGQKVCLTGKTYDVGLATFTTADGKASEFAQELSTEWTYEEGVYLVLGVRWAAAMEDGSTVIAAVRTDEGELDGWEEMIASKYDTYDVNPTGSAVDRYFKDGLLAAAGHEGGP